MENKITFGRWEGAALVINAICARIFLNFPRAMAEESTTAGWLEALCISLLILFVFFLIQKLYSRFEGKDILEVCQGIFGGAGRIFLGSVFILVFLFVFSITLREYSEDLKIIALPETPISFVSFFLLSAVIIGTFAGLEAVVRFHSIVVPVIIIGLLIILLGVIPYFEPQYLLPLWGNGIPELLKSSIIRASVFSPLLYLFLIVPFIKTHQNLRKVGFLTVILSGVLLTATTAVYLMVYQYPSSIENFLPVYHLARLVSYGEFFQRVESVFVFIWVASALLYLSAILFFLTYVFKKTFRLEYSKPLILPFASLLFALSLIPPNLMTAMSAEMFYNKFSGLLTILLPLAVLVIASIKKNRRKGVRT